MSSYIQVYSNAFSCDKLEKVLQDCGVSSSLERCTILRELVDNLCLNYDLLLGLAKLEHNFGDDEVMSPSVLYNVLSKACPVKVKEGHKVAIILHLNNVVMEENGQIARVPEIEHVGINIAKRARILANQATE